MTVMLYRLMSTGGFWAESFHVKSQLMRKPEKNHLNESFEQGVSMSRFKSDSLTCVQSSLKKLKTSEKDKNKRYLKRCLS